MSGLKQYRTRSIRPILASIQGSERERLASLNIQANPVVVGLEKGLVNRNRPLGRNVVLVEFSDCRKVEQGITQGSLPRRWNNWAATVALRALESLSTCGGGDPPGLWDRGRVGLGVGVPTGFFLAKALPEMTKNNNHENQYFSFHGYSALWNGVGNQHLWFLLAGSGVVPKGNKPR